ncbi:hypothetical protein [Dapis sp. BLCC M229]
MVEVRKREQGRRKSDICPLGSEAKCQNLTKTFELNQYCLDREAIAQTYI